MPLFGPKKVCRLDFGYYWADHEAIYLVKSEFHDPAAMERFGQQLDWYLGWLTLHQVWSLSLPYKRMLRDALKIVLALGPFTPEAHFVGAREEDRVITLRSTWHQHRSGAIQPVVKHDLGPRATQRGMTIEDAVVRALTKIWRHFTYDEWCELLAREQGRVALVSHTEELIQRAGAGTDEAHTQRLHAHLANMSQELAEIREELAQAGEAETLKAALRDLIDDWDANGFPHGVGGEHRIR